MSKRFICSEERVVLPRQISIDGKFAVERVSLPKDQNKVQLFFTPKAYIKMFSLVDEFSTEVQWHGLVKRIDDFSFVITDILVFPHEASAATVISDEEEYTKWLDTLDDEDMSQLRFHGHSHVNMGITPSVTDNTYRKNLLGNFGTPAENDDFFYIFLIANKRREYNIQVFDFKNNSLYDYKDDEVDVIVLLDEDEIINTFINEAKRLVKKPEPPKYVYPKALTPSPQTKKNVQQIGKEKKPIEDEYPPFYDDEHYGRLLY